MLLPPRPRRLGQGGGGSRSLVQMDGRSIVSRLLMGDVTFLCLLMLYRLLTCSMQ